MIILKMYINNIQLQRKIKIVHSFKIINANEMYFCPGYLAIQRHFRHEDSLQFF